MADSCVITNEYGKIVINKSPIVQIVSEVVAETDGVRLASLKETLPKSKSNVDVSFDDGGAATIRVFVIIKFGTSISNATYAIISEIKNRVTKLTDIPPLSVSISIIGTQTNKRTEKRNIEVRRAYGASE